VKVFASDLDQTLIYSKRWLPEPLEQNGLTPYQCVEIYNGDNFSFMYTEAAEALIQIQDQYTFIPVTTRTRAQYERIRFHGFEPLVAVVANGGIILNNGQVDQEWEKIIQDGLKSCTAINEMQKHAEILSVQDGFKKFGNADELFFYMITDPEKFDRGPLQELYPIFEEHGWEIHDQGKKVYFVPNAVSKGRALQYLKEKNGYSRIVSAGDSKLDESMIRICNHFLVPGHSGLNGHYKSREVGLASGRDLINEALRYLEE